MSCGCTCGRELCAINTYKACETEEERQERIKASKRRYYQRNRERMVEYKRQYDKRILPFQQSTNEKQMIDQPQLELKIITPSSQSQQSQLQQIGVQ